jgi:uncharacterized protein (DUF362 family)
LTKKEFRLYIETLGDDYLPTVQQGFDWIGVRSYLKWGDKVCVKPNLTFPTFCKGVMTNPAALEAVVVHLKNFTNNITICESDAGGYNRFSMDEVFRKTGIAEFAKRHGVQICNMSFAKSRSVPCQIGRKTVSVPLPSFVLDEADLFVSMPVPKVHSNAIVSVTLKNQWGLLQEPSLRLKLHPFFKEVIYEINKALPRTIAIVDGKYGLNRNGPLRGDVVELDWMLISDNLFLTDLVVSDLMGFDWRTIPYLRYAFGREGIKSLEGVEFNRDYRDFKKDRFFLRRQWTDYPGVLTFNSRFLAYLGYESILAKRAHWLLYHFREPFY